MKNYEINCLASAELGEIEAKNFREKIVSFIQKEGGVLITEAVIAKKKLESPIKRNTLAYSISLGFQFSPEKIADLEKELKADKSILRYLLLHHRPRKPAKEPRRLRRIAKKTTSKTTEPKVELKEIEKKLEEILNE